MSAAAASVIALAGLGWFGFWLLLGTLGSVADSSMKTTLTFKGFVANAFFLLTVACAVYFAVGTL